MFLGVVRESYHACLLFLINNKPINTTYIYYYNFLLNNKCNKIYYISYVVK